MDIAFTVFAIASGLYTVLSFLYWTYKQYSTFNPGADGKCTICARTQETHFSDKKYCASGDMTRITSWVMINFLASVSFSVGKLFPPDGGYINCSSVRCLKVVHNAVLTLACFPFEWIDAIIIEKKVMVEKRQSSVGSAAQVQPDLQSDRIRLCVKILQVLVQICYLLYDLLDSDAPGPGSTVLVVAAVLFQVVLIGMEFKSFILTFNPLVLVTVPPDSRPGDFFSAQVPGRGLSHVRVPENAKGGDSLQLWLEITENGMELERWILAGQSPASVPTPHSSNSINPTQPHTTVVQQATLVWGSRGVGG